MVPLKLKKRPLGEVMRGALLGASEGVHNALARTEQEQAAGVWLMAESEAADIADPLASVLQRRAGTAVDVAPDINDLIAAGVALAAYVISNARKAFRIRRALRVAGVPPQSEENPE